jgi:hypothetical protein
VLCLLGTAATASAQLAPGDLAKIQAWAETGVMSDLPVKERQAIVNAIYSVGRPTTEALPYLAGDGSAAGGSYRPERVGKLIGDGLRGVEGRSAPGAARAVAYESAQKTGLLPKFGASSGRRLLLRAVPGVAGGYALWEIGNVLLGGQKVAVQVTPELVTATDWEFRFAGAEGRCVWSPVSSSVNSGDGAANCGSGTFTQSPLGGGHPWEGITIPGNAVYVRWRRDSESGFLTGARDCGNTAGVGQTITVVDDPGQPLETCGSSLANVQPPAWTEGHPGLERGQGKGRASLVPIAKSLTVETFYTQGVMHKRYVWHFNYGNAIEALWLPNDTQRVLEPPRTVDPPGFDGVPTFDDSRVKSDYPPRPAPSTVDQPLEADLSTPKAKPLRDYIAEVFEESAGLPDAGPEVTGPDPTPTPTPTPTGTPAPEPTPTPTPVPLVPELEPGEEIEHYKARVLELKPETDVEVVVLTDTSADPEHGPNEVVRVNPPPGEPIPPKVIITGNPPTCCAPPAASDCDDQDVRAFAFGPLTGLDPGTGFPFGAFAWVSDLIHQLDVGAIAPAVTVNMPGDMEPLVIDLDRYTGWVVSTVHPILLWGSMVALILGALTFCFPPFAVVNQGGGPAPLNDRAMKQISSEWRT